MLAEKQGVYSPVLCEWSIKLLYNCLRASFLNQIQKRSVDEYKGQGTTIPSFVIRMKLIDHSESQSLTQRVNFEGLEPSHSYITLTREPEQNGIFMTMHIHTFCIIALMHIAIM